MIAIALVVILSPPTIAQSDLENKAKELQKDFSKPIVEWDDSFVVTTFQRYLNLYLDLLWEPDVYPKVAAFLPARPPRIHVEVAGELRTPYVHNDEMVVPVEYIRYLGAIGSLLGHDVYVEDNFINIQFPLLSGPFRKSLIIPLLQPLSSYLDIEGFQTLQTYLMCPKSEADCATVQNQSETAMVLFAILHELSHEVLHHSVSEEGVNLDHEIAADKNASAVLSVLAQEFRDFPPDLKKEIQFVTEVSAVVFLDVEAARAETGDTFPEKRKDALLKRFSAVMQTEIEMFLAPEHSATNVEHVTVDWNEVPNILLIDGIVVPIADIEGKEWTVTAKTHTVIALRSGEIAGEVVSVRSEGSRTNVHLVFKPFPPVNRDSVEDALRRQQWLEALSYTTDEEFRPRDPALTYEHFEALHKLGLDGYIRVQDWNLIPKASWRNVQAWQNDSAPLSSWY
jgi:hypothetical protein